MDPADVPELERTSEDPLLTAGDHCLLLRAVQARAPALLAALGPLAQRSRLPIPPLLRAIAQHPALEVQARFVAEQVLGFYEPLAAVPLPASYAAVLQALDEALAQAQHPLAVLHALAQQRGGPAAFACGLLVAQELIGEGLELSSGITSTAAVFGRVRPAEVARACARGCAWGAMAGALEGTGPRLGATAGGTAWAVQAALSVVAAASSSRAATPPGAPRH